MRAPWLGDVLRDAGLTVLTPRGNPVGVGREMRTIYGVVGHDTVTTTAWTDLRVDNLIRDGRSDLPGPLYQLGLDRQGRMRWFADGRANHNGFGTWGNDSIGISCYVAGGLSGREEPWNDKQQESFVIATKAILDHLNLGPSGFWNPRVAGHKETDRGRKPDPFGINMNTIRIRVANADQRETEPEDARTPFERWWDSMDKNQQAVLEALADAILEDGPKGQPGDRKVTPRTLGRSFARQSYILLREDRQWINEMNRLMGLKKPGGVSESSLQGIVMGAINTVDAIRDLGYTINTDSRHGVSKDS